MQPEARKYLQDMLQAMESIVSYFPEGYNFHHYLENQMRRRAVERELEIIGEAMNRLLKLQPEIGIPEAKRVIALRNRVIHGYDSVDNVLVWAVVVNHLPALKVKVEKLLKES